MRPWGTTIPVYREQPDGTETEVTVVVAVSPGEPTWFDPLRGVGHPGTGPEVEIEAARLAGVDVELTWREVARVDEQALELYADALADPESSG